jgi:hypothetical protein
LPPHALHGFPASQIDIATRRTFAVTETLELQF